MKKIFSLLLAVLMLVSALPVAYAADVDYTVGTEVVYTAANTESYSITVPASLAPGASGTVTLSGSWASNQTVKVTADSSVTLTNSINAADQKTLAITFAGMEYAGDNTQAKTYTEPVSVAAMPSDALFGSWDGQFNYNVETISNLITFTIDGTEYQADKGMTWSEWFASDYNTTGKTEENVQTITDSEGISVELSAVIVDGTAYEVSFIPVINLDIDEYAILVNVEYAKCIINGISYNLDSTDTQLQLPVGTTIECYATGGSMDFGIQNPEATITVNGQVILSTSEDNTKTETLSFTYTVTGDATIKLDGGSAAGHITITEK